MSEMENAINQNWAGRLKVSGKLHLSVNPTPHSIDY